ncbi:MAG: siderophore-interacting protein [Aeromicrobium sp.]|uniref:siderophore-interacting protein n=1 Tax=Aeromicrobium sp. TaxID=1871063 RepID=UPI0039E6A8B5
MSRIPLTRWTVVRAVDLTRSMRRLVLTSDDFDAFVERWNGDTDAYVKLAFVTGGSDEPVLRTYTVRRFDRESRQIWIDFVVHGDEGLAGPWARAAEPGATIDLRGPGSGYRPDPEADHHLFVGDEAGWPAVAASLEALHAGARATAFVEVDGSGDEQDVETAADVDLRWLRRAPAAAGTTSLLDEAVRAWAWPEGRVRVFVHGESALLKTVRPYVKERGVERADLSVSAYWRRGVTEEGFRAWKAEQRAAGDPVVVRPEQGDA